MFINFLKFLFYISVLFNSACATEIKSTNVDFIGCIWEIPEKFSLEKKSPMEFIRINDVSTSSLVFREVKFDPKKFQSKWIRHMKTENFGRFFIHTYKENFDSDFSESGVDVFVITDEKNYILTTGLTDEEIRNYGKNCLI